MKKNILTTFAVVLLLFACKNSDKSGSKGVLGGDNGNARLSLADSLYQQLIDEHNIGMTGWMKIKPKQTQIKTLLDSIAKLPTKAQSALVDLKSKLKETQDDLAKAYDEMDTWMPTLNLDSALNNPELRIKYLSQEKINAANITRMIDASLQKADSLLKTKF